MSPLMTKTKQTIKHLNVQLMQSKKDQLKTNKQTNWEVNDLWSRIKGIAKNYSNKEIIHQLFISQFLCWCYSYLHMHLLKNCLYFICTFNQKVHSHHVQIKVYPLRVLSRLVGHLLCKLSPCHHYAKGFCVTFFVPYALAGCTSWVCGSNFHLCYVYSLSDVSMFAQRHVVVGACVLWCVCVSVHSVSLQSADKSMVPAQLFSPLLPLWRHQL